MYHAQDLGPISKSMPQIMINNVFILTDDDNVRFDVSLPPHNHLKSYKIWLVILTLGNDIPNPCNELVMSWEEDTNSWERHSKLVGTTLLRVTRGQDYVFRQPLQTGVDQLNV